MSTIWFRGILDTWFDDKGYGFITPDTGGEEERVFVHITAVSTIHRRPRVGAMLPIPPQLIEMEEFVPIMPGLKGFQHDLGTFIASEKPVNPKVCSMCFW